METYIPSHVCSRKINFEIEDGIIKSCEFIGAAQATHKASAN